MTDEDGSAEIELDMDELLVLEHLLTPSELQMPQDESGLAHPSLPSKEMCLKIGWAWLEAQQAQASLSVTFNAQELWIMRERVDIFVSLATSPHLGMTLKRKLYTALREVEAAPVMGYRLVSEHTEQNAGEVRDALREVEPKTENEPGIEPDLGAKHEP